jgi:TRAP-type mannitol/chloroaromatic compound transport system permease small subunit
MKIIQKIYNGIGLLSEWSGRAVRWLLVPLIISIAYDVFMRYVFNAPTIWSFELSYMLGATLIMVGFAYVLYHRGHVSVDLIYSKFPRKVQLIIDIVLTVIFFFPLFFMLTKVSVEHAFWSCSVNETATESVWYPIIWPFKIAVALGFALLFLQGVANFLKDVMALIQGGGEPW